MASSLSVETDTLNDIGSLYLSEQHSETEKDEPSEETTDSAQGGVQLISKKKSNCWCGNTSVSLQVRMGGPPTIVT